MLISILFAAKHINMLDLGRGGVFIWYMYYIVFLKRDSEFKNTFGLKGAGKGLRTCSTHFKDEKTGSKRFTQLKSSLCEFGASSPTPELVSLTTVLCHLRQVPSVSAQQLAPCLFLSRKAGFAPLGI